MSIATGIAVALTLPALIRPGAMAAARTPVEAPALAWLAALALAATFAFDPSASAPRLTKGLMPLLVPLAAWHTRAPQDGRRAVAVLLAAGAASALAGLVPFALGGGSLEHRARGLVGHYMTFAGQLLLFLSVAVGVAARARGRWRLAGVGVALVTGAALGATFTRSAWIGAAVALGIVAAATRPRWMPLLAAGAMALFLLAPPAYRARATSAFDPHHPANLERTYMWQAGLAMFRDRPLTGVGLQDMKPVYDRYKPPAAHERAGHLHSVPIQIAASMGLVGLAAFAWLVVALFRAATRGLRPMLARGGLATGVRLGVAAGLAGFLVAGLFEWNFGDEELLYLLFTLVGLAWAARAWDDAGA